MPGARRSMSDLIESFFTTARPYGPEEIKEKGSRFISYVFPVDTKESAEEIIAVAEQIPIPCGICYEQDEVARDPQVQARDMLTEVPSPDGDGSALVTGIPLRMSGTELEITRSFPVVGEHNEEIFSEG